MPISNESQPFEPADHPDAAHALPESLPTEDTVTRRDGPEARPTSAVQTDVEQVHATGLSSAVRDWLTALYTEHRARLDAELARGVPWQTIERRLPREQRTGTLSAVGIAAAAAVPVERRKRAVLTEIGLRRLGNPPLDLIARRYLPGARENLHAASAVAVRSQLDRHLGRSDAHRKRLASASTELQREELAWVVARAQAQQNLMASAGRDASVAELQAVMHNEVADESSGQQHADHPTVNLMDPDWQAVPAAAFFPRRDESPLALDEWCALPTRPVVSPAETPGPGAAELATFLFDRILYASQVCDRNGQAVGLSAPKRQEYLDKITYCVEHDLPITASEYIPLVAIGNPIKRNTQAPALAELDVLRRLSEIAHAVELYYPRGMHWLIGNEAPAFQGPNFNLPSDYVYRFQEDCQTLVQAIDPSGARLSLFDEAEVLWGTPDREAQWHAYETNQHQELRQAYGDPTHPDHEQIRKYINTYIYPMATCISPYEFEAGRALSVPDIAAVYAALKAKTGSEIRGVGSLDKAVEASTDLSPTQDGLLTSLQERALDLTFQYRVAMDGRDVLPAFQEVIPPYTIAYTMVTKREKLVLYPNSGRGAYFPAHGEPVLVRPRDPRQRTVVTVRPWWQIATHADQYVPMYLPDRDEPLYFEERPK